MSVSLVEGSKILFLLLYFSSRGQGDVTFPPNHMRISCTACPKIIYVVVGQSNMFIYTGECVCVCTYICGCSSPELCYLCGPQSNLNVYK